MQRSKLYQCTDYKSTIYSICMNQNLLFFMEKLPKMAVSWSKIEYFGLRQAVAEPSPHFEGAGCKKACCVDTLIAQTQFTAFLCPKIRHFSTKSATNSHFFIIKFFFLFSLKQAAEPPPLPIGGCSLQKRKIRQRTTYNMIVCAYEWDER